MAKINIEFNGKIYSVDETTLAPLASPLIQTLVGQLAGTGAVIKLGGNNYEVDSNKLANARNVLTGHFSTIAGTDSKVIVAGTEYGLSKAKLQGATDKMTGTLGSMAVKASEGLEYELNEDGQGYSVIGIGTCTDNDIIIPSTYEGLPVTRLKSKVEYYEEKGSIMSITTGPFQNNTNITSVYIPTSITTIDGSAFYGCTSLASITIGNGVTSIGIDAFYNCTNLTGVYITDIAKWCDINFGTIDNPYNQAANPLFYAKNLYLNENLVTELVIPNSVTSIKDYAFHGCNFLSISIPNSVNTIGKYTFADCNSLMDIYINTPEDFVKGAFWGAPFAEVHWNSVGPGDEPTEPETPDEPAGTLGLEFELNEDEQSYSVIGIGTCTDTDVIIPATHENLPVTQLKSHIEHVEEKGTMMETHVGAFENNTNLSSVYIPSSVINIDVRTFYGCSNLTSVTIPDRVASIGNYAFYNCSNLDSINIPYNLRRVGSYAFYGYSGDVHITNITRWCGIDFQHSYSNPSSGNNVYLNGNLLTNLVIPDTVTEIKRYAFYNCDSLESVTIPNSVTSIGYNAFESCNSLTSVYITDIAKWCGIDFYDSSANPVYYTGKLYIEKSETKEYELLTNLVIPDTVTEIEDYAFCGCDCLTSITIPGNVTIIRNYAFEGCGGLSNIVISEGVTELGHRAFNNCVNLTNIVIPNTVKSVSSYVFSDCTNLASVTISNGITKINYGLFQDCTALTDIVFDGTMEQWNNLSKESSWNDNVPATYVQCTDGQVTL